MIEFYLILLMKKLKLREIEVPEFIKVNLLLTVESKIKPTSWVFVQPLPKKHATCYYLANLLITKKSESFLNTSYELKR